MSRKVCEILAVLALLLAGATVAVSDTPLRRTVLERSGFLVDYRMGSTRCPLHGVALGDRVVPIAYGLAGPDAFEEMKRAQKEYPFAYEWAGGGCVVGRARWAIVDVCARCVERKKAIRLAAKPAP